MLKNFFTNLGDRFYKENDLSDVTYTFLQTDDSFKEKFLQFFFPSLDVDSITTIEREYSKDDSRPDFIIETENEKYLIEVKIWDKNHHFEQYKNTFSNYKKAYVTNYNLSNKEKESYKNEYNFITWKEIYEGLEQFEQENELIKFYRCYLKRICYFREIKNMRFGDLRGLLDFGTFIEQVLVEKASGGLITSLKQSFDKNSYGESFNYTQGKKSIKLWFGAYWNEDETNICLSTTDADAINNAKIKETLKGNSILKYNSYGVEMYISMQEKYYATLQETENVEEQKELIKDFFEKALEVVSKSIK